MCNPFLSRPCQVPFGKVQKILIDAIPVDDCEPVFDIVRPPVKMLQVIGVLPDINVQERKHIHS